MDIFSHLKQAGAFIADLLFPISCVICGHTGVYLCDPCRQKLPELPQQLCIVCKKPAPFGKTHVSCASRNTLDGVIAALTYTHPDTKKLIETFKYEFIFHLGKPLSKLIIQTIANNELEDYFQEFKLLPVPLHPRRQTWRGFNQAELLGQVLAADLKIPMLDQLLIRSKFTQPQTKLQASAREHNIKDAFQLTTSSLPGSKFILVDDVFTTGATLNEIAKLLKRAGAVEVWAATIAHG